jgi:RNA polymerase sigma-70 factor (ECF subfamily)
MCRCISHQNEGGVRISNDRGAKTSSQEAMGSVRPPLPPPPSGPARRAPLTLAYVCDQYGPFMRRYLLRLGVPHADVEDVMQEALCVVAADLSAFTPYECLPLEAALRMWLRSICFHKVLEHRRAAACRVRALPLSESDDLTNTTPGPDAVLLEREELREVLSLVDALPPARRAVVLACLAGCSVAEVAKELGIAEGTAWTRLRTAKAELEEAMARRRKRERSFVFAWWLSALDETIAEHEEPCGPGAAAASILLFAVLFACLDVPLSVRPAAVAAAAVSMAVSDPIPSIESSPPPPAPAKAREPSAQTPPLAPRGRPVTTTPRPREHREERAFLAKAQEALAAGRRDDAAAALAMHRRRFPDSALADVRQSLEAKLRR